MNCLNAKPLVRSPLATAPGRGTDDDLDLDNLIINSYDDDESDRQSEGFNNSGTSDESTTSLDNGMMNHCVNGHGKSVTNGKSFFKSLPMAILSRKKLFGSHSDLSNQRPASPVIPVQLSSSMLQSTHHHSSFKQVKSPLVKRAHSKNNVSNQMTWSVWITDANMYQDIELPYDATCSLLLHMLLLKLQRQTDLTTWSIILQNSEFLLERIVEDHEILVDIKDNWPPESINRLCLNRAPTKFEILLNPEGCLPQGMLTMPAHTQLIIETTESRKSRMQNILTKTAPEFSGWLHVKECGARFWKKSFCVLRNSGLYCSSKGESKEPRHLQCFADVLSSHVWNSSQYKKCDSSSYCFCIKGKGSQEMKWLSADSLLGQRAWINAIRLIINGNRFYESYLNARRRGQTVFSRLKSSAPLSSSENNLVAMDFSGNQGRVISDPSEVAMMELEQQTSWRKKIIRSHGHSGSCHPELNGSAPAHGMAWIARSIHQTQPWFFGKISREDAAEVLHRHGLVEGSFLVRDSHRIPGGFVITLCHNQKIKHIAVSQMEIDGQWCFSLDNGETRFADLLQLIDFHRLNRGTLPCRLQHEALSTYS